MIAFAHQRMARMKDSFENELDASHPLVVDLPFMETEFSGFYRNYFKRAIDVALVSLAALPALAVVLIFAGMVALDGRNPFYTQIRVGKGGRRFRIWKLRSMVCDADAALSAYLAKNPEAAREWETKQKLKKDPRITWIGRCIRKSSIDELPQLWNVLSGTMSLVGPRPFTAGQEILYTGKSYFKLRPGVTGPWQVSDRHNSAFSDRVWYDEDYHRKMSFKYDLTLIARTFKVVLRCTGV